MELIQYLNIVRKWIWLVVLAVVLAVGASLIVSLIAVPIYRTTTTVIVSQVTQSRDPNVADILASQQLAQTYVQLITREPILSATVQTLGLRTDWQGLRGQISARPVEGTQLLEISVLDTSPERAKIIADEIAHQLILQSPTTPGPQEQERLTFIRAQLPELESRIQTARQRIASLDEVIATASSGRQIQSAQQEQKSLQDQINQWQATYGQLVTSLGTGSLNYLSVVEPATIPHRPVSPNIPLNVGLAAAVGLTLSVSAAFLLEYLDDTIRSPEEVQAILGAPVLAGVGRIEGGEYPAKLVAQHEPRSPLTEAYRSLRTNLQFSTLDTDLKIVLVTSPGPSEGKSITAANLAVVLAQAGMSVVLVDGDLRRPVMHKIFGLKNHVGLTSWLVSQESEARALAGARAWPEEAAPTTAMDAYLQPTEVPGLRVMTSGALPPNPAEVLGSVRMRQFIDDVTQLADIVILDSPPCVTVTDAVVLSRWVNGVVLVLDSHSTHRQGAKRARENLQAVGAKLLGAVVNRLDSSASGYYYYAYYSPSYYHTDGKGSSNGKPRSGLSRLFGRRKSRRSSSGEPHESAAGP
jgi:succinoglycan biosynthesis transport protein ExoP